MFLTRYGYPKALVLARFIPLVRTVVNPLAGVLAVPTRTFTLWQVIGGLVWSLGVALAGYVLGSTLPGIDRYLLPVIALILVVSVVPVVLKLAQARRADAGNDAPGREPTPETYREPLP